jgi:hypothetical protein
MRSRKSYEKVNVRSDRDNLFLLATILLAMGVLLFLSPMARATTDEVGGMASSQFWDPGNTLLMKITPSSSGILDTVGLYIKTTNSGHVATAIYSDSANQPNVLLGNSASASTGSSENWQDLAIPGSVVIAPGTTYWLAFQVDTSTEVYYNTGGSNFYHGETYGNWANPAGGLIALGNIEYIRMSYTFAPIYPKYYGGSVSDAHNGTNATFAQNWVDSSLSSYIFSDNFTGAWANVSDSVFGSDNISYGYGVIPSDKSVLAFCFYANNTGGYMNTSCPNPIVFDVIYPPDATLPYGSRDYCMDNVTLIRTSIGFNDTVMSNHTGVFYCRYGCVNDMCLFSPFNSYLIFFAGLISYGFVIAGLRWLNWKAGLRFMWIIYLIIFMAVFYGFAVMYDYLLPYLPAEIQPYGMMLALALILLGMGATMFV